MTHRENVNASLETTKTQFGEAQAAVHAANQNSQSMYLRLGAVIQSIEGALRLDPRMGSGEPGGSMSKNLTPSVQDARTKVRTAHTSLVEVSQGTTPNSSLAEALMYSRHAVGFVGASEHDGEQDEVALTTGFAEQMDTLAGVYEALSQLRAHAATLETQSMNPAAVAIEKVVPQIEEYQQRL